MFPERFLTDEAMVSIERPPGQLVLRYYPVLSAVLLGMFLCIGLAGVISGVGGNPGCLWGAAGLAIALLLALTTDFEKCTLDGISSTITFERWGPRGYRRHVRWLADLAAVRVKVVGHGGCDVWLSFNTGEPVRLFSNSLGTKGVDFAREIHGFAKLEAPVQVEN